MNGQWVRVTRAERCAVCGKPDWCTVSPDGVWACCMRVEGSKAVRNGGWLHRLLEAPPVAARGPGHADAVPRRQMLDPAAYHAALRRRWDWRMLDGLALSLGVDMESLEGLEPGFDEFHAAFAFPMRNAAGEVVGVRLRNAEGRKWAVRGSREGLFYEPGLSVCRELVVCEGPTDCAAARMLELPAVGRPSCSGAVGELVELAGRVRARLVTIVADDDAPRRRPDGKVWYPGLRGAMALGSAIGRTWRVLVPPAKDLRAWVCGGATRDDYEALAKRAKWSLACAR